MSDIIYDIRSHIVTERERNERRLGCKYILTCSDETIVKDYNIKFVEWLGQYILYTYNLKMEDTNNYITGAEIVFELTQDKYLLSIVIASFFANRKNMREFYEENREFKILATCL